MCYFICVEMMFIIVVLVRVVVFLILWFFVMLCSRWCMILLEWVFGSLLMMYMLCGWVMVLICFLIYSCSCWVSLVGLCLVR